MILDVLVYGFIQSMALILMAFGFSLVYGVSRLPNFAHGAVYVLTGFVAWGLVHRLGLPYLAAIPVARVAEVLSPGGIALITAGGALYLVGGAIYARKAPNPWPGWFGFHEVFHVLVVVASALHAVALWRYALPLA